MIDKKHFLAQIEKVEAIYDEKLSPERLSAYYDMLAPDFTDEEFDDAINRAVKTSFRFPPVAAFYRKEDLNSAPDKLDIIMKGVIR